MNTPPNWSLSDPETCRQIQQLYKKLGIPCDIGVIDHPAFLKAEQKDPKMLNTAAYMVESQSYSAEYLARSKALIELVADAVSAAVQQDGRAGLCINASGAISRMLDQLGIWNYLAKASLTILFPAETGLADQFFWAVDSGQFEAPHAFVVAPPFSIIDVTIKQQAFKGNQATHLPAILLEQAMESAHWEVEDIVSPTKREQMMRAGIPAIHAIHPDMTTVMEKLPARWGRHQDTRLKYIPVAVGAFGERLSDMTFTIGGRTPQEIFDQDVVPKI